MSAKHIGLRWGALALPLVLILFSAVMLYSSQGLRPLSRMIPLGVLSVLLVLSTLLVLGLLVPAVGRILGERSEVAPSAAPGRGENAPAKTPTALAAVFAWGLAPVPVIYVLGFLWGAPFYTLLFALGYGRRNFVAAVLFAGAVMVCFYGLFTLGLRHDLYEGWLPLRLGR